MTLQHDGADRRVGDASDDGAARGAAAAPDINRASLEELARAPGIGLATATRIVRDRERHGPFGSLEDLLRVPRIGERRLERMRPTISISGADGGPTRTVAC